jgi:hypothetical protein
MVRIDMRKGEKESAVLAFQDESIQAKLKINESCEDKPFALQRLPHLTSFPSS